MGCGRLIPSKEGELYILKELKKLTEILTLNIVLWNSWKILVQVVIKTCISRLVMGYPFATKYLLEAKHSVKEKGQSHSVSTSVICWAYTGTNSD